MAQGVLEADEEGCESQAQTLPDQRTTQGEVISKENYLDNNIVTYDTVTDQ